MPRRQAPLLRRCVTCRSWGSKIELLRVTRSPTGEVMLDLVGKLPGRGAYLHRSPECLGGALRKHYLEKALRRPLSAEAARAIAELAAQLSEGSTTYELDSN
ncbi:MAG: DUF448 domain-containing protein [Cyanobacteria bacterium REEB65]|nr:DUF448 domain-containing protein [Cyanobacteria bacterium REEB65]